MVNASLRKLSCVCLITRATDENGHASPRIIGVLCYIVLRCEACCTKQWMNICSWVLRPIMMSVPHISREGPLAIGPAFPAFVAIRPSSPTLTAIRVSWNPGLGAKLVRVKSAKRSSLDALRCQRLHHAQGEALGVISRLQGALGDVQQAILTEMLHAGLHQSQSGV